MPGRPQRRPADPRRPPAAAAGRADADQHQRAGADGRGDRHRPRSTSITPPCSTRTPRPSCRSAEISDLVDELLEAHGDWVPGSGIRTPPDASAESGASRIARGRSRSTSKLAVARMHAYPPPSRRLAMSLCPRRRPATTKCSTAAPARAASCCRRSRSACGTISATTPRRALATHPVHRLRPRHHPFRPRQQLRPAARLGRRILRHGDAVRLPALPRRDDHLDQGRLGDVGRALRRMAAAANICSPASTRA